ncbi:MAG: TetR/AcrR family transcriptional regulator [Burkholderiaceae bacterium]|nr:MAG: TetR/AcrR family transcriptional regulator [Burkholderiaceae bacterium]
MNLPLTTLSKSVRRREEIIQCATELFDKQGFFNTSLDDVAQAVGLKREALYYYFKNRTELLLAIIEPQAIDLIAGLESIVNSDLPAEEKLRRAMENHLERFDRHCLEMTITLRDGIMGTSDPVKASMTRVWKTYEKLWTSLIEKGQAFGQFDNTGDPKMVAFGILGMCNWLARWYKPDKAVSIEQLIDTYFKLVSQGLSTPSVAPSDVATKSQAVSASKKKTRRR